MTALREQCIDTWMGVIRPQPAHRELRTARTTRECRLAFGLANEYLGWLLQANGCKAIDEIVQAAEEAASPPVSTAVTRCDNRCMERREKHGPQCAECGACQWDSCHDPFRLKNHMFAWPKKVTVDRPAFFAAILTEALAKGRGEALAPPPFAPSWFERYSIAEFGLPCRCRQDGSPDPTHDRPPCRRFAIPEFAIAEAERT